MNGKTYFRVAFELQQLIDRIAKLRCGCTSSIVHLSRDGNRGRQVIPLAHRSCKRDLATCERGDTISFRLVITSHTPKETDVVRRFTGQHTLSRCTSQNTPMHTHSKVIPCPAVEYFYARSLHATRGIPVRVIFTLQVSGKLTLTTSQ